MTRSLHFHLGMDSDGARCVRLRSTLEVRRCRERLRLKPKVVWVVACGTGRELWRNGMHRRRWSALAVQVRGDRCCFLTTLKRPPLIHPIQPF